MGRSRFFGNKGHGVMFIGGAATHDLADGDFFQLGDKIFEIDEAADGVVAGRIAIDTSGDVTAAAAVLTIIGVINGNKPVTPLTAEVHPGDADHILLIADKRGGAGNMVYTATFANTSTITGSGNLQFGENGASQIMARNEYIVEAEDASATQVVIDTGLTTARHYKLQIYSSAGVEKAWDGALILDSNKRLILDNSGAVDWIDTDIIRWEAWE